MVLILSTPSLWLGMLCGFVFMSLPHSHCSGVTPAAVPPAIPDDFERRVRTLEQQVQRLTETIVRRDGASNPRQGGNGFWYVLTFAGWMMVPLVVAFMYHYKKTL